MNIQNTSTAAKWAFAYSLLGASLILLPGAVDAANLLGTNVPVSSTYDKTVAIAKEYNQIVNNGKANYVVIDKATGYIRSAY